MYEFNLFKKGHDKSGLYNLNEDEELTHYGQSLSEIEKFENPVSSDDDDNDGKLAGTFCFVCR